MQRFLMLFLIIPFFCLSLQSCHHKKNRSIAVNIHNPLINEKLGALFLVRNKLNPRILILPSGLQYATLQEGIGDPASLNDWVMVYYQGQYIGGQVFDNQHYQNNPITIPVSSTIPGWRQALQLMRPGSVWVLFVPPHLAYGDKGFSNVIGPRQTVIYTIHLMAIKKKPK